MPKGVAFSDAKIIIFGGDREEKDDFEGSVKRPKGNKCECWHLTSGKTECN